MDLKSSLIHSNTPDFNYHIGYEGAVKSKPVASQQYSYSTWRKKSKVRLNDQLIPKPTDVNMGEKMIKIATPKQHPFSSHISQFAMFPSFRSPDDPETGVRASSKPFLNPLIPNRAPDVTVMSKTIGCPFRHEILESPVKNSKKAVMWIGKDGFLDHAKPLKGENQVFYPTPPKTVLPNPKLRDWDLTLSERTTNMLKNLEKTHWLTSYQMHYTGSGPANPLMTDDFMEKISDPVGMDLHTTPLKERSFPVFVPAKPSKGRRRRQRSCEDRSTFSSAAELQSQSLNHGSASTTMNQPRPPEITAKHNEAEDPNQKGHNSSGSTEAPSTELSQEGLYAQQNEGKSSVCEGKDRENCRVQFDQSVSPHRQKANTALMAVTERPLDLCNRPLSLKEMQVNREKSPCVKDESCSQKKHLKVNRNVLSQSAGAKDLAGIESELLWRSYEQEKLRKSEEMPHSVCTPCILPRPPVLPGIISEGRVRTPSLLDLQNSFSKTAAHHNFNSSVTRAAVNLRDNVVTGKKHNFFGVNCNYLHG